MQEGLHHFHKRTRGFSLRALLPSRDGLRHWFDRVVYAVSVFGIAMTTPQLWEVWVRQEAGGVSVVSFSAYTLTSLFWFVYGILHREPPLIVNYSVWALLHAFIAIGAYIYG